MVLTEIQVLVLRGKKILANFAFRMGERASSFGYGDGKASTRMPGRVNISPDQRVQLICQMKTTWKDCLLRAFKN